MMTVLNGARHQSPPPPCGEGYGVGVKPLADTGIRARRGPLRQVTTSKSPSLVGMAAGVGVKPLAGTRAALALRCRPRHGARPRLRAGGTHDELCSGDRPGN